MAKKMTVLGAYDLDERGAIIRKTVNTRAAGDYGADPVGDGTFKMVPSGDVVNLEERNRRLNKNSPRWI